jgi:hypothetical protein
VCLLLVGSYIPQLLQIAAVEDPGNSGISVWYIILLSLTASTLIACRTVNFYTQDVYDKLRRRELRGWKAFSALLHYIPPLVQWVAAASLYLTFVAFLVFGYHGQGGDGDRARKATPSNTAILATVCAYSGFVVPLSACVVVFNDGELHWAFAQAWIQVLLAAIGTPLALVSGVPQMLLIVARSRSGVGLGNLSVLGLGLQVLAFAVLAVAQRLRSPWETPDSMRRWYSLYMWVVFVNPAGVGYAALALSQLLVLGVALGIGRAGGKIPV